MSGEDARSDAVSCFDDLLYMVREQTMLQQNTLLVGNGLNRASNPEVSWGDLLRGLCPSCLRIEPELEDQHIPAPIQFEMIGAHQDSVRRRRLGGDAYSALKREVRDRLQESNMECQPLHRQIRLLGVNNVITTNYDRTLEKAFPDDAETYRKSWPSGSKYLFEESCVREGVHFYYAHGILDNATSICIGYEHYIGYVQKMRSYFLNKVDEAHSSSTEKIDDIVSGAKTEDVYWPDLFFSSNVYIVGLGLDFSEIDLWWLLTLRASYFQTTGEKYKNRQNSIVYFDVMGYDKKKERKNEVENRAKKTAKAIALSGLQVEYCPIVADTYESGYFQAFRKIEEEIKLPANSIR